MVLSSEEVKTLLSNPDKAAELANLVYVSEEELCVERKKQKDSFEYLKNGKPVKNKKQLERYKKLVIPPAWEDVKICPMDNGHLQAIGRDAKNRKQYLYHPDWGEIRNRTKFFKMASFGKILPKIRQQVDEDLDLHKMPQRKVLALIVRLMEETHIRIGNECYAKENKSYGLSTLRKRHVEISKGKMNFHFIGKKGKEHTITVQDKKLVKLVNKCEEIPGWEVFKYYDEDGKKNSIDSGMVNQYIQEISGELYSAKDFRTWSATKIFFENLRDLGYTENEKENKSNILKSYDAAAEALGNTRSVCRNYYVHPMVVELYQNGGIVPYFEKVERKRTSKPHFSQTEEVLLGMISDYEIEIS
ncbi:DNA topoisomerase [Salinimicrobium marinum]|uniref:DNA topoisomerase n=1 Tax=Salinimicrobium marinum TaxID=680283 RepID=A0A918SIT7_9FLAO|nr:DNA topoisomerase IB [Salinimicrobium marinum]GHA47315.1 DNA topoisomerase [Salinimicrobium marinum]